MPIDSVKSVMHRKQSKTFGGSDATRLELNWVDKPTIEQTSYSAIPVDVVIRNNMPFRIFFLLARNFETVLVTSCTTVETSRVVLVYSTVSSNHLTRDRA